ncbi:MAG: hypothetical protein PQJ46_00375 [Spirochaetales bacterium]|nr:hypothetical protein [Spirochaetales bacterium]
MLKELKQSESDNIEYKDIYLPPSVEKMRLSERAFSWMLVGAVILTTILNDFGTNAVRLKFTTIVSFLVLNTLVQHFSHWPFYYLSLKKYEKNGGRKFYVI